MLPIQERIFLYKYLGEITRTKLSPKTALKLYIKDLDMNKKYKKELNIALLFFSKYSFANSLYKARLIPKDEYIILKSCLRKDVPNFKTFANISNILRTKYLLKRKIKNVLIYPLLLACEFIFIFTIALFWLSPQMNILFKRLKINPPTIFTALILIQKNLKHIIKEYYIILLIILPSLIWFIFQFLHTKRTKQLIENFILRLGIIGHIYRLKMSQEIFGILYIITQENAPKIHEGIKTTALCIKSANYKKILLKLSDEFKKKRNFKQIINKKEAKPLFPLLVRRMMSFSNKKHNYKNTIKIIYKLISEELDLEIKKFISMLEPFLILSIAAFVATLALTIQKIFQQAWSQIIIAK